MRIGLLRFCIDDPSSSRRRFTNRCRSTSKLLCGRSKAQDPSAAKFRRSGTVREAFNSREPQVCRAVSSRIPGACSKLKSTAESVG